MAFCAKIFLHESPGSHWIIRSCDRLPSKSHELPTGAFFQSLPVIFVLEEVGGGSDASL